MADDDRTWVVLAGNPVEGWRVVGPWDDLGAASEWAQTSVPSELLWIEAELEDPSFVSWPD